MWRIRTASPGGNVFNEGHANVLSHTQVMDGRSDGRHADSSTDGRHTVDQCSLTVSLTTRDILRVTKLIRSAFPNSHLRVSGSRDAKRQKKDAKREEKKKKHVCFCFNESFFSANSSTNCLPSFYSVSSVCYPRNLKKFFKKSLPISLQIEATISLIAIR